MNYNKVNNYISKTKEVIKEILDTEDAEHTGLYRDADTILADIIDETDTEVSGSGYKIIKYWNDAPDESKQYIEFTFESLTGITFHEYIDRCTAILPSKN